jgi:cold shock protein
VINLSGVVSALAFDYPLALHPPSTSVLVCGAVTKSIGADMPEGTVKWFNSQKGYGFIQPQGGGKDVFVHISAVERAGLSGLNEGQAIEYEEVSNRGKTSAENLRVQR